MKWFFIREKGMEKDVGVRGQISRGRISGREERGWEREIHEVGKVHLSKWHIENVHRRYS